MHTKQIATNENGVVPIIVTIFIVIILSLITIGFAQLMRREQRRALDRQLSTQAFYAAETAVNDAAQKIIAGSVSPLIDYTSDCHRFINDQTLAGTIDASGPISYPCLLIDQAPKTLEYNPVLTDHSTGVVIKAQNGAHIGSVEVSWQGQTSTTSDSFVNRTPRDFPPLTGSGGAAAPYWPSPTGVMRVSLTPTAGALNRDNLLNSTYTTFLYPFPGAGKGSTTFAAAENDPNQGELINGHCATTINLSNGRFRYCNVVIDGLNQTEYFLRMKSIYTNSIATITAYDTHGNQLRLVGAQAMVDATGKANDVLRRIQVRVRVSKDFDFPEAALDSAQSLCKRFSVWPPNGFQPDPIDPSCSP